MTEDAHRPVGPGLGRIRRLTIARARAVAPYVVAIDGIAASVLGVIALVAAGDSTRGESLLFLLAGLALIPLGLMMVIRWNFRAIRTGLAGMTAGYFAIVLTEFEVRTDPCDIGATMAACAGHVVTDTPWGIYQGPAILAALLFIFLALEPLLPEASLTP